MCLEITLLGSQKASLEVTFCSADLQMTCDLAPSGGLSLANRAEEA
jgi:hypothetical protein